MRRNYEVTDASAFKGDIRSNGLVNIPSCRAISAGGDLEVQLDLDTQVDPPPANYSYNWKHLDLGLLPVARAEG